MKFAYLDAPTGLSGDMILGALIDLGVSPALFREKMAGMNLPADIRIKETRRASLRGLRVEVQVETKKTVSRKWKDVEALIQESSFSPSVKKNALAIFKKLYTAEARVHGKKSKDVHLHEAGADDALIDVLGCCFLVEELNISEIYSSPLNVGAGTVKTSHGILPVPPPAVAELLKNVPVYSACVEEELVTPTGAAIVTVLAKEFVHFPEITYEKIGCGAGRRNFSNIANILRIFYGDRKQFTPRKNIYTIESNIDDSSPQILAHYLDRALKLGALDVFLTPVVMKKNRLATKLTVLAEADKIDVLTRSIFKETSSIGVRYFPVERIVLERKKGTVTFLGEEVGIKVCFLEGKEINIQPEFSDCQKLARKRKLPVKEITNLVLKEYYKKK